MCIDMPETHCAAESIHLDLPVEICGFVRSRSLWDFWHVTQSAILSHMKLKAAIREMLMSPTNNIR